MMDRSQMITAKNCATDVQKWTNRNKFDNFDLFGFLNTTESIRPLFHLLPFVFSNKQCKIFNKLMWSNIHLPSFERRLQLTVKNCAANIWKRKVEELDTDLFGLWLNMYGRTRPLINLLSIFSNFETLKNVDYYIGIWTRLIGVEGEHADHKTNST